MEQLFDRIRNFFIGRKYSEEISKAEYKLFIVDKPYYRYFLIAVYSWTADYCVFAYHKSSIIENWLFVIALYFVFFLPLYLFFMPHTTHRYTILSTNGWLLSPGITMVSFQGNIPWRNIRRIEKSIFGTGGRNGFYIVARYYTITLNNGKIIVVNRVFSREFEERLEAILAKKKILFTNVGLTY